MGIATPFAPMPVPALMLKTGTRDGSISAAAEGAPSPVGRGEAEGAMLVVVGRTPCLLGKAEVLRQRREMMVVVVKICILRDSCVFVDEENDL